MRGTALRAPPLHLHPPGAATVGCRVLLLVLDGRSQGSGMGSWGTDGTGTRRAASTAQQDGPGYSSLMQGSWLTTSTSCHSAAQHHQHAAGLIRMLSLHGVHCDPMPASATGHASFAAVPHSHNHACQPNINSLDSRLADRYQDCPGALHTLSYLASELYLRN